MASIPLLCNICQKQRKFSDLSHLLTHVGSKGHLSHYFKLQVRSRQDPAARDQLAAYDQWYEKYEVERLLSERLTLKESKKVNARRGSGKRLDPVTTKHEVTELPSTQQGGTYTVDDLLDPQLSHQRAKSGRAGFANTLQPTTEAASKHRTHVPRMHIWPTARERAYEMAKQSDAQSLLSLESEIGTVSDRESGYSTPSTTNRTSSYYPDPSTAPTLHGASFFESRPGVNTRTVEDDDFGCPRFDDVGFIDVDGENSKLKGILWPGMDIFDSATPEMRRKRNQKKDGSVLAQMMINAAEVEPTELIFTPEGHLKKQRAISGMVESSSPVKDSPKPKRRRSNSKKSVLTEISGNNPRITKNNRGAKPGLARRGPWEMESETSSRRALANLDESSTTWTQGDGRRYLPTEDEDAEWRLTLGDIGRKKKTGFKIFADTEQTGRAEEVIAPVSQGPPQSYQQPSYYGYNSQDYGHVHGLSLLNSEFNLPSVNVPTHTTAPAVPQDQKSVPAYYAPTQYRVWGKDDKENKEPMANRSGRMEQQIILPSVDKHHSQQYISVDGAHPAHFHHGLPRHMDYGAIGGPEVYGGFQNPLTYNFQPLHAQQNTNQHTSSFQFKVYSSPRRRMDQVCGSESSHRVHHTGTDTFGLDMDEQNLFGDMTD
ncbi:hypothetical protein MMC16_003374 [Acarospora aff. strigata]|nr:hypothetical protein [Acarospora aff. strigata]